MLYFHFSYYHYHYTQPLRKQALCNHLCILNQRNLCPLLFQLGLYYMITWLAALLLLLMKSLHKTILPIHYFLCWFTITHYLSKTECYDFRKYSILNEVGKPVRSPWPTNYVYENILDKNLIEISADCTSLCISSSCYLIPAWLRTNPFMYIASDYSLLSITMHTFFISYFLGNDAVRSGMWLSGNETVLSLNKNTGEGYARGEGVTQGT